MSLLKSKNKDTIIQENQEECISLIENSFLKDCFNEDVTDVSYNGETFFAQDNIKGRYKIDLLISSDEVYLLIKKIANFMLQPFSTTNPCLNISFGDYRLNAVHPSLARNNNKKVITFSLRKITTSLKIKKNDENLCPIDVHNLLDALMKSYQSILISGQTGAGKTEFQKYLVSLMNDFDRLILIEDSYETHIKELFPNMDVTNWVIDNSLELSSLIKMALRNNPDWLIVTEVKNTEAYDFIQASMTGHSAITTIHSDSALYSLDRLCGLCKKSFDVDENLLLSNMAKHIKIGVHLEKSYNLIDKKYVRQITEIVEYIPLEKSYKANIIFKLVKLEGKQKYIYNQISKNLKEIFLKHNQDLKVISKFLKGEKDEN